jgi:hypothetical protein
MMPSNHYHVDGTPLGGCGRRRMEKINPDGAPIVRAGNNEVVDQAYGITGLVDGWCRYEPRDFESIDPGWLVGFLAGHTHQHNRVVVGQEPGDEFTMARDGIVGRPPEDRLVGGVLTPHPVGERGNVFDISLRGGSYLLQGLRFFLATMEYYRNARDDAHNAAHAI